MPRIIPGGGGEIMQVTEYTRTADGKKNVVKKDLTAKIRNSVEYTYYLRGILKELKAQKGGAVLVTGRTIDNSKWGIYFCADANNIYCRMIDTTSDKLVDGFILPLSKVRYFYGSTIKLLQHGAILLINPKMRSQLPDDLKPYYLQILYK